MKVTACPASLAMGRLPVVLGLVILLGTVTTGCSSGPQPKRSQPSTFQPLAWAIRVVLPTPPAQSASGELRLDALSLERSLRTAFAESRVATSVSVIEDGTGVADEADLELRVECRAPATFAFSGRTGWFIPNTLLWFFGGFPSFWVADRAYAVEWDAQLRFRAATTARELKTVDLSLRSDIELNIVDRGWTAEVLYTPPGLYEGPQTASTLEARLETWLVNELIAALTAYGQQLSDEVEILVESPANLGTLPAAGLAARVLMRSPTVLERLRLEIDHVTVYEKDALTMVRATRLAVDGRHEYDIRLPLRLQPGEHLLQVQALRRGETDPGLDGRGAAWSATRSVRFVVTAP